jgi:hypothetical protein
MTTLKVRSNLGSKIEAVELKSAKPGSAKLESTKLESVKIESTKLGRVKPKQLEAETPETGLLDASSLQTVLVMLEVIDSIEDLALLETLTPDQKRQVWDATPDSTRTRLTQLRTTRQLSPHRDFHSTDLLEPADSPPDAPLTETSFSEDLVNSVEEMAAIDLEAQRQEVDLMLQEPLNLSAQPRLAIGDWVVLHASPNLSKADMQTIWEVSELQGNYARIAAKSLGSRLYPTVAMTLYPRANAHVS